MREVRLKNLGRWYSGGTPPRDDEAAWSGDVPWISAKDIDSTQLRGATTFITEDAARRYSRVIPPRSLLLVVRGMALAHGLPVVETVGRVAFNQDLRALVPDPRYDSRFIYYALIGYRWRLNAHIDRAAHGTARVAGSVYSERILIPDSDQQSAIAHSLDRDCARIDDLSEALSKQLAELDVLRAVTVRDATTSLQTAPLKHVAQVIDCKHRTAEYVPSGGMPLISTREVTRGALVVDGSTRRVRTADYEDLRRGGRDPRRGDIIYSRNATVGVAAFLDDDAEVCMGQDVVLLTRRPRDSELVNYVLNWTVEDQIARLSVGSTFTRINVVTLREVIVPYGSPDREHAVAQDIRMAFARLSSLEREFEAAQRALRGYKNALIREAVTGQLDVTKVSDAQMDERLHEAVEIAGAAA